MYYLILFVLCCVIYIPDIFSLPLDFFLSHVMKFLYFIYRVTVPNCVLKTSHNFVTNTINHSQDRIQICSICNFIPFHSISCQTIFLSTKKLVSDRRRPTQISFLHPSLIVGSSVSPKHDFWSFRHLTKKKLHSCEKSFRTEIKEDPPFSDLFFFGSSLVTEDDIHIYIYIYCVFYLFT